jgi:hypothetical protein
MVSADFWYNQGARIRTTLFISAVFASYSQYEGIFSWRMGPWRGARLSYDPFAGRSSMYGPELLS